MCEKYSDLIMKYMDNSISNTEKSELLGHTVKCEACKSELMMYSEMLQGFENFAQVQAPVHFTQAVMQRVKKLELSNKKSAMKLRSILVYAAFGAIASMFASIIITGLFGGQILTWAYHIGAQDMARLLTPMYDAVLTLFYLITDIFSGVFEFEPGAAALYSYVALVIFIALIAVQVQLKPTKSNLEDK